MVGRMAAAVEVEAVVEVVVEVDSRREVAVRATADRSMISPPSVLPAPRYLTSAAPHRTSLPYLGYSRRYST